MAPVQPPPPPKPPKGDEKDYLEKVLKSQLTDEQKLDLLKSWVGIEIE